MAARLAAGKTSRGAASRRHGAISGRGITGAGLGCSVAAACPKGALTGGVPHGTKAGSKGLATGLQAAIGGSRAAFWARTVPNFGGSVIAARKRSIVFPSLVGRGRAGRLRQRATAAPPCAADFAVPKKRKIVGKSRQTG